MNAINIQDAVKRAPFKPFTLELDNGKEVQVKHPDFIFLTPKKTTAVVVEGEHLRIIDIDHITSIRFREKVA